MVHGQPLGRVVLGVEDRGDRAQGHLGVLVMATFVTTVLALIVAVMLVSLVLAHFGIVVLMALGLVLLGRYVRRHGV